MNLKDKAYSVLFEHEVNELYQYLHNHMHLLKHSDQLSHRKERAAFVTALGTSFARFQHMIKEAPDITEP